ncbi:hypothetical protein PI125_g14789 [Phytophthora idaei]|nr:hypothetical protein PI125_g14789 [Phytophthora idaei]KAG3151420.1 hypothetical protein PI126_g11012 [Phytophthora idaei]
MKDNGNSSCERVNEQDEDVKSDDIGELKFEESAHPVSEGRRTQDRIL